MLDRSGMWQVSVVLVERSLLEFFYLQEDFEVRVVFSHKKRCHAAIAA